MKTTSQMPTIRQILLSADNIDQEVGLISINATGRNFFKDGTCKELLRVLDNKYLDLPIKSWWLIGDYFRIDFESEEK